MARHGRAGQGTARQGRRRTEQTTRTQCRAPHSSAAHGVATRGSALHRNGQICCTVSQPHRGWCGWRCVLYGQRRAVQSVWAPKERAAADAQRKVGSSYSSHSRYDGHDGYDGYGSSYGGSYGGSSRSSYDGYGSYGGSYGGGSYSSSSSYSGSSYGGGSRCGPTWTHSTFTSVARCTLQSSGTMLDIAFHPTCMPRIAHRGFCAAVLDARCGVRRGMPHCPACNRSTLLIIEGTRDGGRSGRRRASARSSSWSTRRTTTWTRSTGSTDGACLAAACRLACHVEAEHRCAAARNGTLV
jgi:hypothetical protein